METQENVPTKGAVARWFGAITVIAFGNMLMGGLTSGLWLIRQDAVSISAYAVMMAFMVTGMLIFTRQAISNYNNEIRLVNDCPICVLEYCMKPGVRGIVIRDGKLYPTKQIPDWSAEDIMAMGFCVWGIPFAGTLMVLLHLGGKL